MSAKPQQTYWMETFGTHLDFGEMRTMLTARRPHKVRNALRVASHRSTLAGEQLQVLVWHATLAGLARRPSLAIFSAVYAFTPRPRRTSGDFGDR